MDVMSMAEQQQTTRGPIEPVQDSRPPWQVDEERAARRAAEAREREQKREWNQTAMRAARQKVEADVRAFLQTRAEYRAMIDAVRREAPADELAAAEVAAGQPGGTAALLQSRRREALSADVRADAAADPVERSKLRDLESEIAKLDKRLSKAGKLEGEELEGELYAVGEQRSRQIQRTAATAWAVRLVKECEAAGLI
jgi:hypothetical protein